jgi:iron complex outermembrane receptor protein
MKLHTKRHVLCSAVTLAVSLLVADVAMSQQVLEEVVVTARKRAESLQNVPMAVSAFTAQQLRDAQIDNITDLQKMTPNITINETSGLVAGAVQVYVRGIGNDPGFDQGVGIYVDDVYLNSPTGALLEVYDVERIEVLKGPQGNLYGRNTIGGAIKYITREPSDELEMSVEAKIGTDEMIKLKGAVSGPIIDGTLYGALGVLYEERDGYQTNEYDGSEWASRDTNALRGTLLWQATDNVKLKLVGDYNKDESEPTIPVRVGVNADTINEIDARTNGANAVYGPGTAAVPTLSDTRLPRDEDTVNTAHLFPGYTNSELKTTSVAGTITWEINDSWTVKSVTAWRKLENPRAFDFDGTDQIFINTFVGNDREDLSQELQFNYSSETIQAVFGFYYLDGSSDVDNQNGVTDQQVRMRFWDSHFKTSFKDDRDIESTSVYGNVDWDFAENWQLSLGGRYTEDTKEISQIAQVDQGFYAMALTNAPGGVNLFTIAPGAESFVETQPEFLFWFENGSAASLLSEGRGEQPALDTATLSRFAQVSYSENTAAKETWDDFSPSARITYHVSDDIMVYGGFSSGFKSGGFATDGEEATAYEPEFVDSYSLGIKSTLLDGSLRLNAELFLNDYTDKQLATITLDENGSLNNTRDNVGEVETSGFEVEMTWLPPVDGLLISLNVGYLNSDIKEFQGGIEDPATGETEIGDVSDDRALGFNPEWTGQARIAYDFDIGSAGSMLIAGDVAYRDEMYTDSPIDLNNAFQSANALSDSLTTYNAIVAFSSSDDKWRVALEGKNLTDERELVNTFNAVPFFMAGGYNRERTWAFSVRYTH